MTNGKKAWVRFEIRSEDMEVVKIDLVPPGEIESNTTPAGMVTVSVVPPMSVTEPGEPPTLIVQVEVFADPDQGIYCAEWALPNSAGRLVKAFVEEAFRAKHGDWVAAAMARAQAIDNAPGEGERTEGAAGEER